MHAQHGFARNLEWEVESTSEGASPSVTLKLKETAATLEMWAHKFTALYTVALGSDALSTTLKVNLFVSVYEWSLVLMNRTDCTRAL